MFLSPECLCLSGRRQLILGHFLRVTHIKMHSTKCIHNSGDAAHVSLFSLSQDGVQVGHDGWARQWGCSECKVKPLWLLSVHHLSTFVKSVHSVHSQMLEIYCFPIPPRKSINSQDGDDDSESDSSDSSCSPSKSDSADFQSSLRRFEMSESKRKRLRELEASAFFFFSFFFLMFRFA